MTTSAFGVEHHFGDLEEVSKLGGGMLGRGLEHVGGFFSGTHAGMAGKRTASVGGYLNPAKRARSVRSTTKSGVRTGQFMRRNAKPLGIGAAVGGGGVGMYAANRNY